ncbi:MAG: hypothetical protein AB7R40_24265 [Nitrospiraceae bacterium]
MAQLDVHVQKAEMFWGLAQKHYGRVGLPFMTINLAMYALGHFVEALLAHQLRHPSSPVRGVPHGDREAMLRKYLVPQNIVAASWADHYSELSARRDTFIDGGIPDRGSAAEYMALAAPLVSYLKGRVTAIAQRSDTKDS